MAGGIKRIWPALLVIAIFLAVIIFLLSGCTAKLPYDATEDTQINNALSQSTIENPSSASYEAIVPKDPYGYEVTEINGNVPLFSSEELTTKAFEQYSPLDNKGRVQTALACCGPELMPTEERGEIGMIKPTGWHTIKYDCVNGKYLYNRCHLIMFALTGENANEKNLMTGTRYLNTELMLPYETEVLNYIEDTKNHVMYRVTPIFLNDNLLASGIFMEAYSVEDYGKGICFFIWVPNTQPQIKIDYATGESSMEES